MRPGDLVEYSSTRHGLHHEPPPGTYGILLKHTRMQQWAGGKWLILWAGQKFVIMAMELRVVGRGEQ